MTNFKNYCFGSKQFSNKTLMSRKEELRVRIHTLVYQTSLQLSSYHLSCTPKTKTKNYFRITSIKKNHNCNQILAYSLEQDRELFQIADWQDRWDFLDASKCL